MEVHLLRAMFLPWLRMHTFVASTQAYLMQVSTMPRPRANDTYRNSTKIS